jgi:hypothetical protein
MDNYPENIAPEFDEGGGVKTPFDVWWETAKKHFVNVPEELAEHWLHEHWNHSPFGFLESRSYDFDQTNWPLDQVGQIRSRLSNYEIDGKDCLEHGRYLLDTRTYRTSEYMKEHGSPPSPIVVIDNNDGHLKRDYTEAKKDRTPDGYILAEGHRRYAIAFALSKRGQLSALPVWVLKKKSHS